jgi:nucleotide-binding universal stress UspA family protein
MTYRIVVGVDGSKHSRTALLWALNEALGHSGEVTALFAWQVSSVSPGAAATAHCPVVLVKVTDE